jgi:hypothetical protein
MLVQSNPAARWHVCQGSINCISFSADGAYLATVGRDGIITSFIVLFFILFVFFFVIKYLKFEVVKHV